MSSTMESSKLPLNETLQKAAEISMKEDKPICLDYFMLSITALCCIARDKLGNKVLFKNDTEFTSPLLHMFKVEATKDYSEYIFETQNSVYVVSGNMLKNINKN